MKALQQYLRGKIGGIGWRREKNQNYPQVYWKNIDSIKWYIDRRKKRIFSSGMFVFGYINLRCQMPLEPGIICVSEFEARKIQAGNGIWASTSYSPISFENLDWENHPEKYIKWKQKRQCFFHGKTGEEGSKSERENSKWDTRGFGTGILGDGQGGLVCCSPQGHKELDTSSWTEPRGPRRTNGPIAKG